MMKLAICDDDIKTISRAEEVIAAYNRVSVLDSQFSPSSFTCPTTLRDEITDGQIFDAFILDIEMEMLDGKGDTQVYAHSRYHFPFLSY